MSIRRIRKRGIARAGCSIRTRSEVLELFAAADKAMGDLARSFAVVSRCFGEMLQSPFRPPLYS